MRFEVQLDSLFGWNSTLHMGGRESANLKLRKFSKSGEIDVDGELYAVEYQGLFSGVWELKSGRAVVATATKKTLQTKFAIEFEGQQFELARASILGGSYSLRQRSREIGILNRNGMFSRGMSGQLPDDWSPARRAFVVWLVMMIRRRKARARSS